MADSKRLKQAKADIKANSCYKYDWNKITAELSDYIDTTDDPQLKEFCIPINRPCYDSINDECNKNPSLLQQVKRLIAKQEVFLTRAQGINPVLAIFRLKQACHGYKDKQEIDIKTSDITIIPPPKPE